MNNKEIRKRLNNNSLEEAYTIIYNHMKCNKLGLGMDEGIYYIVIPSLTNKCDYYYDSIEEIYYGNLENPESVEKDSPFAKYGIISAYDNRESVLEEYFELFMENKNS